MDILVFGKWKVMSYYFFSAFLFNETSDTKFSVAILSQQRSHSSLVFFSALLLRLPFSLCRSIYNIPNNIRKIFDSLLVFVYSAQYIFCIFCISS